MGLDMFLTGRKCHPGFKNHDRTEDGFEVTNIELELGYWRKHPNLHGYIVKTFADGVDECQAIPLNKEKLQQLIEAVEKDELPTTSGFFFGVSNESSEQKESDIKVLTKAIEWLEQDHDDLYREVFYRASW